MNALRSVYGSPMNSNECMSKYRPVTQTGNDYLGYSLDDAQKYVTLEHIPSSIEPVTFRMVINILSTLEYFHNSEAKWKYSRICKWLYCPDLKCL